MMIRKERGNQFIGLTFLCQSPWSRLQINKGFMLAKAFGRRQGAPRAILDNSAKSFGAHSPHRECQACLIMVSFGWAYHSHCQYQGEYWNRINPCVMRTILVLHFLFQTSGKLLRLLYSSLYFIILLIFLLCSWFVL